jgi:hypothetical protein
LSLSLPLSFFLSYSNLSSISHADHPGINDALAAYVVGLDEYKAIRLTADGVTFLEEDEEDAAEDAADNGNEKKHSGNDSAGLGTPQAKSGGATTRAETPRTDPHTGGRTSSEDTNTSGEDNACDHFFKGVFAFFRTAEEVS